jgi:hypothetical protein
MRETPERKVRRRRLTIFAKGNVDVRNSLHSSRVGGQIVWNGVNDIIRERFPGVTAHVKHETAIGVRAFHVAKTDVPAELITLSSTVESYPPVSQFGETLFEGSADLIVLSVQPEIWFRLHRHRASNRYFYAGLGRDRSPDTQQWLDTNCDGRTAIEPEAFLAQAHAVVDRIRSVTQAPMVWYAAASVLPGPPMFDYSGVEADLGTRIRQFNLALIELSRRTGVAVVDVDAVVAKAGAERLMLDALHLTGEGYSLVAREFVRVAESLGVFDD